MRFGSLVFVVALAMAPLAQAQPPARAPIRAATPCDLAAVLLKEAAAASQGSGGMIYDAAPYKPMRISGGARRNEPPPGVPPDLARRWNASDPGNMLQACPAVAKALPPGVRLATDAQRAAVRGIKAGDYLQNFSAPLANAAGDHVLIELSGHCAGLCGGGVVHHFQKTRRGWVELPPAGMWMS